MVERPLIPKCCDNPDQPYRPGATCICLCHHLTPEDLAEVGRLADQEAMRVRLEEAMSARPDDTCPKCGEAVLYYERTDTGMWYSTYRCSDQKCGWRPTPWEQHECGGRRFDPDDPCPIGQETYE